MIAKNNLWMEPFRWKSNWSKIQCNWFCSDGLFNSVQSNNQCFCLRQNADTFQQKKGTSRTQHCASFSVAGSGNVTWHKVPTVDEENMTRATKRVTTPVEFGLSVFAPTWNNSLRMLSFFVFWSLWHCSPFVVVFFGIGNAWRVLFTESDAILTCTMDCCCTRTCSFRLLGVRMPTPHCKVPRMQKLTLSLPMTLASWCHLLSSFQAKSGAKGGSN